MAQEQSIWTSQLQFWGLLNPSSTGHTPSWVSFRPRPRPCCLQACRSLASQERPRSISRANRHIYKVCAVFAQPLGLPAQPTCKLSSSPGTEPTRHGHGHLSPEVIRKWPVLGAALHLDRSPGSHKVETGLSAFRNRGFGVVAQHPDTTLILTHKAMRKAGV